MSERYRQPEDIATELMVAWLTGPAPKPSLHGTEQAKKFGEWLGDAYTALVAKIPARRSTDVGVRGGSAPSKPQF